MSMYIHMYMAKNIMVSDEVYNELKTRKLIAEQSYTEVIKEMMEKDRPKTLGGLLEVSGILKGDTEYDEVMKNLDKMWKRWKVKYV